MAKTKKVTGKQTTGSFVDSNGNCSEASTYANKSESVKYSDVYTKTVNGREYVVKSVYVGTQDIKDALLKIAERKAVRDMGLDV